MARSNKKLNSAMILQTALELADASGARAVTIRAVAQALGVTPMSLYRHIEGKEALIDAMVDAVLVQVVPPKVGGMWRDELYHHAHALRRVLLAHPWALPLMDSRMHPGPATLARQNNAVGTLYEAGFSYAETSQALATLDAFIYGFVQQEVSLPFDSEASPAAEVEEIVDQAPMANFPYLTAIATEHIMTPTFRFSDQFAPGLNLVLDGVDSLRKAGANTSTTGRATDSAQRGNPARGPKENSSDGA